MEGKHTIAVWTREIATCRRALVDDRFTNRLIERGGVRARERERECVCDFSKVEALWEPVGTGETRFCR